MVVKKLILFIVIFCTILYAEGQSNIYKTNKTYIGFSSDAPLELIQASSDQLTGLLNISDKSFAFKVAMNTFEGFNSAMQKTHFKENYIETDKFPNATFSGKIIEDIDFSEPGIYSVRGKGKFSVHGVEQIRIIKCKLIIKPGLIEITSDFSVFLDEHNIKIPSVVNQKIAEEITLKMKISLKPMN